MCLHTVKTSARDRKKGRKSKKGAKVGHDSRGRKMAGKGESQKQREELSTGINIKVAK